MQDPHDDPQGGRPHQGRSDHHRDTRGTGSDHASGLARIAAGGAVLARRAPPPTPRETTQAGPADPGNTPPGPRSAQSQPWPVLRPAPAVPGGASQAPPKVDTGTRPQPVRSPAARVAAHVASKVDTGTRDPRPYPAANPVAGETRPRHGEPTRPMGQQGTPPGNRPERQPGQQAGDPRKVDTGSDAGDLLERMPMPAARRPVMPPRPGTLAPVRPPTGPSEERITAIRLARKTAMQGGREHDVPSPGAEPTRTAKTVDAYRVRGEQLVHRFMRERDHDVGDTDSFNPQEFAVWLLALRVTLKPNSWRLYRQAALMVLGSHPGERAQEAMDMIDGDAPAEAEMGTGETLPAAERVRLTSAQKRKFFAYEDYVRIDAYLRLNRRSTSSPVLQDWLRAGIATGLRPSEWKATEVVRMEDTTHVLGRRVYLLVLNAKATNGRANGLVRTLDISMFSDGAVGTVQRMSNAGLRAYGEGRYREFQSNCAQVLHNVCRKLWDRRTMHYSLYSCRHQFIANMKALQVPHEEISAMAGHRVDDTVAHSYARARSAWSPDKVTERARGMPEEVATVKRVLHIHQRRLDDLKLIRKGIGAGQVDMEDVAPVAMADL